MALKPDDRSDRALQGQILRRNARREAAIYLRNGKLWVADFIDGCGELFDAVTWFRFNCGSRASPQARRRMAVESAVPLYEQLEERIEALHRAGSTVPQHEQLGTRIHPHRSEPPGNTD
jgi:hypothetical protein